MWGRALAGIFPGFFLAAGLTGLLCWLPPGPWQATIVPGIIAFIPLWSGVAAAAFAFSSARRAWAWLGGLAVAALGALWALQWLGWVQ
ncbi:hypothetical protein [Pseudoxanthomonas koreensis]|uniref:hypothetical protein n=1 Tax=Pseudoxanthomonas koreensis TaxID=266061 RepID=UPI0013916697|nr:hypothetical protein [Pseudoxanthomonas koreensis]KAF1692885.1 hypothetical protein CSC64_06325 [Pseudoxanthomonas koreensis]